MGLPLDLFGNHSYALTFSLSLLEKVPGILLYLCTNWKPEVIPNSLLSGDAKSQGLHLKKKKKKSFRKEKCSVDGSIDEALLAFTLKRKAVKEWLTDGIFLVAFYTNIEVAALDILLR